MRIWSIKVMTLILPALVLSACRASSAATSTPSATPALQATAPIVSPTAEPSSTATIPAPSPTPSPSPTPAVINPLSGIGVEDPELLERRPVMVKVANFPRALRPHSGLSYADLVFEYYIGEGSTRFLALYYGQDAATVGPVRSARLIDAQLVNNYQGVLAFVGADARVFSRVISVLGERAVTESQNTCPALCRTGTGDVNSVFADTQQFSEYVHSQGVESVVPELTGMQFTAEPPTDGQPGQQLQVRYSFYTRSEWRYDPVSGKYLRWIEDVDQANNLTMVPLTDRVTGQQLAISNVIVLFAFHTELTSSLHDIEIWANSQGRQALVYRDGLALEAVWKSVAPDKPLQFFTPDGEPLALKPGSTWFEVVGISSGVDEAEAGHWEVIFRMP